MTPEQFVYWLQGFSEVANEKPTKQQWQIIQDHLNLVFDKQTPDRNKPKKQILTEESSVISSIFDDPKNWILTASTCPHTTITCDKFEPGLSDDNTIPNDLFCSDSSKRVAIC